MKTHLSGYFLKANGWKKDGFRWTRGFDTIVYDGTDWMVCTVWDIGYAPNGGVEINWRKIRFAENIKKNK